MCCVFFTLLLTGRASTIPSVNYQVYNINRRLPIIIIWYTACLFCWIRKGQRDIYKVSPSAGHEGGEAPGAFCIHLLRTRTLRPSFVPVPLVERALLFYSFGPFVNPAVTTRARVLYTNYSVSSSCLHTKNRPGTKRVNAAAVGFDSRLRGRGWNER